MIRLRLVLRVAACLVGVLGGTAPAQALPRNILLIIADDFGIDVARFYPTTVRQTTDPPAPRAPNLAGLAQQGLRFNNAWAYSSCSPTRASILTGRYGFRTGIGQTVNLQPPWPVLSSAENTLPEAFRRAGLRHELTHVGKWHLGHGLDAPRQHGWQHFSGPDPSLPRLDNPFAWPKVVDGVPSAATTYVTTEEVDDAVAAIDRAERAQRPYFVWLALNVPHEPFHKPPNELHTRDALPVVAAPDPPLARAYYEAMIEAMDAEIGRLLTHVKLERTTVIFLGDNGTSGSVTAPPYNPDHAKLRVYQQGVQVPMIVAGAGVPSKGKAVNALVNTVDLYPTILELAGASPVSALPPGTEVDGVSLLPLLANPAGPGLRTWAYTERFGLTVSRNWQKAIRDRRYKLIERDAGLPWPAREFFDLKADPYELRNLLDRPMTDLELNRLSALDRRMEDLLATR